MIQETNEINKKYQMPKCQLYQKVGKSVIDIPLLTHNQILLQNQHAIRKPWP